MLAYYNKNSDLGCINHKHQSQEMNKDDTILEDSVEDFENEEL